MNKVWFWMATRLLVVVGLVVGVRLSLGAVAMYYVADSIEQLDTTMIAVDEGVPIGGPGEGAVNRTPALDEDRRAGNPIHPDLEREGQVVVRDGKKVVLVDASDPDNEVWIELGDAAAQGLPWVLRDGWGLLLASFALAGLLYAAGAAVLSFRAFRGDPS